MQKVAAFFYFVSIWPMFHQVGSQILGRGKRGEKWKMSSFFLCALVALISGWLMTTGPIGFSDGTDEGTYEIFLPWRQVAKMTCLLGLAATIEGYGFVRLMTRVFHGKDAADNW